MSSKKVVAELIIVINNHTNNINLSIYNRGQPPGLGRSRYIDGPIYGKTDAKNLALAHQQELSTVESRNHAQDMGLSASQISDLLVLAIDSGFYHTSEWCIQSVVKAKNKAFWVATDVYLVTRVETDHKTGNEVVRDYYLKFGISRSGKMILFISNHLERQNG